jgi:enolase
VYFSRASAYPIVSIEDPFDREDWEHVKRFSDLGLCQVCSLHLGLSFVYIHTRSCKRICSQVVGDDLLMSNHKRIERAIHESSCTALLLKVYS